MATQTQTLGSFTEPNTGAECRFEFDYDDQQNFITAFRCVNATGQPGSGAVIRDSDGLLYRQVFPAGQTTFIPIPTTPPGQRVPVTWDRPGRYRGIRVQLEWPAVTA